MFTSILAFLSAWLPVFLPLILWGFDKLRLGEKAKEDFIKKVQSAKDDGLVSIGQRDEFKKQDKEFKDDLTKPNPESPKGDGPNP